MDPQRFQHRHENRLHERIGPDFPHQHWKKIQSTNPLERLNREIKRRTDVVQVFPNPLAVLRLATPVLAELPNEWIAFPRRIRQLIAYTTGRDVTLPRHHSRSPAYFTGHHRMKEAH